MSNERSQTIQTFGQALLRLRMERGISHRDLGERCGASKQLVKQWERDEAFPKTQQLKRIYATLPSLKFFTHLIPADRREGMLISATLAVKPIIQHAVENVSDTSKPLQAARHAAAHQMDEDGWSDVLWQPPEADAKETIPPEVAQARAPLMPVKTFGEALRRVRLAEGLDQHEVADLVGVTQAKVSDWELNKHPPVVENYEKLLTLFPSLKDAPKPASRDIPKPIGNTTGNQEGGRPPLLASVKPLHPPEPTWIAAVRPLVGGGLTYAFTQSKERFVAWCDEMIEKYRRARAIALGEEISAGDRIYVGAYTRRPTRDADPSHQAALEGKLGLGAKFAALLVEVARMAQRRSWAERELEAAMEQEQARKREVEETEKELRAHAEEQARQLEGED